MSRRRRHLEVSTFPFLAVLLCTMGSLILLLLVLDRRAKIVAVLKARSDYALVQAEKERRDGDRLRQEAEDESIARERQAEWERRNKDLHALLTQEEEEVTGKSQQADDQLKGANAKLQAEQARAEKQKKQLQIAQIHLLGIKQTMKAQQDTAAQADHQTEAAKRELQRQTAELVGLEQTLASLKALRERQKNTYSLVPYLGRRGDNRRPVYVECAAASVIFHPDKVALEGPELIGPRLRSEVEKRIARQRELTPPQPGQAPPRPYLLMLVRPDGIGNYYRTQEALAGMQVDFGYEFIEPDWVLDFSADQSDAAPQPWMTATKLPAQLPAVQTTVPRRNDSNAGSGMPLGLGGGSTVSSGNRAALGPAGPTSSGAQAGAWPNGNGGGPWHGPDDGQPGSGPLGPGGSPMGFYGSGVGGPSGGLWQGQGSGGGGSTAGNGQPGYSANGPGGTGQGGGAWNGQGGEGGMSAASPAGAKGTRPAGGGGGGPWQSQGSADGTSTAGTGQLGFGANGQGGLSTGHGAGNGQANGGEAATSIRAGVVSNGTGSIGGAGGGLWQGSGGGAGNSTSAIGQPTDGLTSSNGFAPGMPRSPEGLSGSGGGGGSSQPGTAGSGGPANANVGQQSGPTGNAGNASGEPGQMGSAPSAGSGPGGTSAPGDGTSTGSAGSPSGERGSAQSSGGGAAGQAGGATGTSAGGSPGISGGGSGFGIGGRTNYVQPGAASSKIVSPPPLGRILGNRDWLIYIDCNASGVVVKQGNQKFSAESMATPTKGEHPLVQAVRQMVARRQATVRQEEPAYRPLLRFQVQPDGLRAYYLAYPLLDVLRLPMTREDVERPVTDLRGPRGQGKN